jgi:hypothetical protein
MAILVGHFSRCTPSLPRFNRGRWREIEVAIEAGAA